MKKKNSWFQLQTVMSICCGLFFVQSVSAGITFSPNGLKYFYPPYNDDREMVVNFGSSGDIELTVIAVIDQGLMATVDTYRMTEKMTVKFITQTGSMTLGSNKIDVWSFPKISTDHKAAAFQIKIKEPPPKGLKSIEVAGRYFGTVSKGEVSKTIKNIALSNGSKFTLGTAAIELAMGSGQEVTFKADKKFENITDMQFFDSKGNHLDVKKGNWTRFGDLIQQTYNFNLLPKTVDITVKYHNEVSTIEAPYKVIIAAPF